MAKSAFTNDSFAQLTPYLELARDAGGEVFDAVGNDIAKKISGGVVGLGVKSFVAVRRAVKTRFSRARAYQRLEKDLAQATSDSDRAAAYRHCLESDPSVGASLVALIERLDFLLALAGACNELPVAMLGPPGSSLATVYVKPRLRAIGGEDTRNMPLVFDAERFEDGSHIIYGTAGTGKSSLARWLTHHKISALLGAQTALSIDQLRLPIYVSARDLTGPSFAHSLRTAAETQLGVRSLRPLSTDIFDIRSEHGHRQWVVVVDGIDEIDDVVQRDTLCRTMYDLKAREPDAFEFILFARSANLPEPPRSFERWEICPDRDPAYLLNKYVANPAERARLLNLLRRPEYRDITRAPLFIAMSAKLLTGINDLPGRPDLLIEAFVANGIDAAARGDRDRGDAISKLLGQIASHGGSETILEAVQGNDALCRRLSIATSLLVRSGDVERALLSTGLVEIRAHRVRFVHRLIDRLFFAQARAAMEAPSREVWHKIDPIADGPVVANLCVEWHRQGKPVVEAIAGLADFGKAGREVMLSLAVRLPEVPDAAFAAAFNAMFHELDNGDVTRDLADRLPALVRTRASVRKRLAVIVEHSRYGFDLLPAASALTAAGLFKSIEQRVYDAAIDDETDPYVRIELAVLMLDNGLRDPALEVLRTVARDGDEDWVRLYAMCKIAVADPKPGTCASLNAMVREDYVDGDAEISPWLIDEIIDLADPTLLVAALGKGAALPQSKRNWGRLDNAFRAASTLAKVDHVAGLAALEALASASMLSLRERLEALARVAALDPLTDMADRICELIDQRPLEIDWRVIQLLDRLNLDAIAWQAGTRYLRHRLCQHHNNYEAWSVLQQLALIAPSDKFEAFIREQLARHPSPRLAASLALVGRAADARNLLTSMLDARDPIRGIDAARELASLGEPKGAKQWLTRTTRDRTLSVDTRLAAARVLATLVGSDRSAAALAMRKLVLDTSLTVEVRCRVALEHAGITEDVDEPILETLAKLARDPKGALADRIHALQTVATVDPHEECCWDQQEIFDKLLDDPALSVDHIPRLIAAARQLEITLDDERLIEIASDKTVPAALRVHALSGLRAMESDRLPDIDRALLAISQDDAVPLKVRLSALEGVGDDCVDQASTVVKSVCENANISPNWRLAFARHRYSGTLVNEQAYQLIYLANDNEIAVSTRLEAYNEALRRDNTVRFPDFSQITDLGIFEYIAIAEAAERAGLMQFAAVLFEQASAVCSTSPSELIALHKLAIDLNRHHAIADLEKRVATIPAAILAASDDKHSVRDAIAIVGQADQPRAIAALTDLLTADDVNLWEGPELIEALAQYVGTEEALRRASPVLDEVLRHLADPAEARFPTVHLAEMYFDRGWLTDRVPLLAVVNDPARTFDERVAAAVLADRLGGIVSANAQRALSELLEKPTSDLAPRLIAAQHLLYRGYRGEALHLAQTCLTTATVSASDRLTLSRIFADIGHSAIADELLGSIPFADLTHAFLLDDDKRRLKSILGELSFDELIIARMHDLNDPYAGLAEARERVAECGDPKALQLLFEVARDANADPIDRLETIDNIEQLGFRSASRAMFRTLDTDKVEPLWIAMQCVRFGWREQSLEYFRRAIGSCDPENLGLVSLSFAELGATEHLKLVERRMQSLNSTIE